MPVVTPADVATYAPGTPAVTAAQVEQAQDWVDAHLEHAGVTLAPGSRAEREARRAVCAYTLSLLPASAALTSAVDANRLESLQDGDQKMVWADRTPGAMASAADEWEARAMTHLRAAGVVPRRVPAGAVR